MTFKLCVGTVLGVSVCIPPILAKQNQDFSKYRVETTSTIKETEIQTYSKSLQTKKEVSPCITTDIFMRQSTVLQDR